MTILRKNFIQDEGGNVAILFGLSMFSIIGAIGGAVDIGRVMSARMALQDVADYAAINLVTTAANDIRDGTTFKLTATSDNQAATLAAAQRRAAEMGANNVTVSANWLNATDLKVVVTSIYPTVFTAAVPGMPKTFNLSVAATARSSQQLETAAKPSQVNLGYEAWDYNRIYMYCYNKGNKDNATKNYGRSQEVAIASNGKINNFAETFNYTPPTCAADETVSFRLYNVRSGSTKLNEVATPADAITKWNVETAQGGSKTCGTTRSVIADCYNWYTDTERGNDGTDTYNTAPGQLETILCNKADCSEVTADDGVDTTLAQTLVKTKDNRTANRSPMTAKGCRAGKFMYFGWEDRPPQFQYTDASGTIINANPVPKDKVDLGGDRDYDDIRVTMNCPQFTPGDRKVRLIY